MTESEQRGEERLAREHALDQQTHELITRYCEQNLDDDTSQSILVTSLGPLYSLEDDRLLRRYLLGGAKPLGFIRVGVVHGTVYVTVHPLGQEAWPDSMLTLPFVQSLIREAQHA